MANFTLQQLTEGIKQRHVGTQNKRLVEKWTRTGLLRGLDDVNRENMSVTQGSSTISMPKRQYHQIDLEYHSAK